jgi:hypothetical protein
VNTEFLDIVEKFYPDNIDKQRLSLEQLATFRAKEGVFGRSVVEASAKTLPA